MDLTGRKITKIARELNKLVVHVMKADGIGTAEIDFIHLVRHHPGITQAEIRENLGIDKGAAARRAASLQSKGYLIRQANPADGRSQLLYATPKAENLRNSKADIEAVFYEWLLAELSEQEQKDFCAVLEKLYLRSKKESRAGFPNVLEILKGEGAENENTDKISERAAGKKLGTAFETIAGVSSDGMPKTVPNEMPKTAAGNKKGMMSAEAQRITEVDVSEESPAAEGEEQ